MDGDHSAGAAGAPILPKAKSGNKAVVYVSLARHDIIAWLHGLPDKQALLYVRLIGEALSLGIGSLPISRCGQVGRRDWPPLMERLLQGERVAIEGDTIRFLWVEQALEEARKRMKMARDRGASRDKD